MSTPVEVVAVHSSQLSCGHWQNWYPGRPYGIGAPCPCYQCGTTRTVIIGFSGRFEPMR